MAKKNNQPEIVTRSLPVQLSPSEVDEQRRHLAAITSRYDRTEDRKKSFSKRCTKLMKDIRAEMTKTAKIIETGVDEQMVRCESYPDGRIVRLDTGEEVPAVSPKTKKDAQLQMAFEQLEDALLQDEVAVDGNGSKLTVTLGGTTPIFAASSQENLN